MLWISLNVSNLEENLTLSKIERYRLQNLNIIINQLVAVSFPD